MSEHDTGECGGAESCYECLAIDNATLRASLAEAQERAEALEKALDELSRLGIPLSVKDACQMGVYDRARFSALEECRRIAKAALSRPSPQATPKPERVEKMPELQMGTIKKALDEAKKPQATTGKECPECGETLVCPKSLGSFPSCGGSGEKPEGQESR